MSKSGKRGVAPTRAARVLRLTRARSSQACDPAASFEWLEDRRYFALAVSGYNPASPVTTLTNALIVPGTGLTLSNASYLGVTGQGGTYTGFSVADGGGHSLAIDDGILLTSGAVTNAPGPNSATGASVALNTAGDTDLTTLVSALTRDANSLTLTFTTAPNIKSILFDFVFGSEEFPEFVGSFNDAFGAYLDGNQISFDAAGKPVTVNNNFFQLNNSTDTTHPSVTNGKTLVSFNLQYDGLTPKLTTQAPINTSLTTHTLKLVVADAGDTQLDSGAFIAHLRGSSLLVGDAITGLPPTANAGGPYTVPFGGTVVLNGSGTDPNDPAQTPLTYQWDLDGDGDFGETGTDAANGNEIGEHPTFNAAGLATGGYTISLQTVNTGGVTSSAVTGTVTVQAAPINVVSTGSLAAIVGVPMSTDKPLATFSADVTFTPLSAYTATINWLDGSTTAGQLAVVNGQVTVSGTHTYASTSIGVVQPIVTLSNASAGISKSASATVTVLAQPGTNPTSRVKLTYVQASRVGTVITDTGTITNTSTTAIPGPIAVAVQFGNPRPASVVLTNATGSTALLNNVTLGATSNTFFAQNSPYVIVAPNGLAPGQTLNFTLTFSAPTTTLFGFTLGAIAGPNLSGGSGNLDSINSGVNGVGQMQFNATTGEQLTNVTLGLFKDFGPALPAGSYAAFIDWADGTPRTPGVVTVSTAGSTSVAGSHAYAAAGKYTPSVTLSDPNSAVTAAKCVITVANPIVGGPVAAANVTSQFQVTTVSATTLDVTTGLYTQSVTIRNTGAPVSGVISLAIDQLSAGAMLLNASGTTTSAAGSAGSPYLSLGTATSVLQTGDSLTFVLKFNQLPLPVYTFRMLSGPGAR